MKLYYLGNVQYIIYDDDDVSFDSECIKIYILVK